MTFFDDDNQTPDAARALDAASGNIVGPAAGERATAPVVARGDAGPTPRPSEPQSAEITTVPIPRWAAELFASYTPRQCAVCLGISPSWDGHDANPPCIGYAREKVQEVLDVH